MKIAQLVLAVLAVSSISACARQSRASASIPYEAGADRDGDAVVVRGTKAERMDAYLSRAAQFGFAGTILIADSTRVLLHKGYGFADESLKIPNSTRTIFDIGSITKPFTTSAILTLAASGRLTVHDRIGRFFRDVPADKVGITLHHLMTHTSGIIDPPIGDYEPITPDSLVHAVLSSSLDGPVGTKYNYSNVGVTMLALIVERVTGKPYEQFLRERLLMPAGLLETGYNLPSWDSTRVAHTYTPPVDHGSPLARLRASRGPRPTLLGNGGMLSTTGDLYRWERALRGGGVLPPQAITSQFAVQFERHRRSAVGYDWDIERDSTGRVLSFSHGSDGPSEGVSGEYRRYLSDQAVIVLLANNRMNGASSRHFIVPTVRRLLCDSAVVMPPAVEGAPLARLREMSGRYVTDDGSVYGIEPVAGHLVVTADGQSAVDLFNARQGPAAIADAHAYTLRASTFIDALASADAAVLTDMLGSDEDAHELLREWKAAASARGGLRRYQVLGTLRLDRRAFLTTVRLAFAADTVVARYEWAGQRPSTHSGDLALASLADPFRLSPVPHAAWWPYWWIADGGLVSFDLMTGRPLRGHFVSPGTHSRTIVFDANGFSVKATEVQ